MYGYAAWNPRKGIISLRNPSGEQKTFSLNLRDLLELPVMQMEGFRLINIFPSKNHFQSEIISPAKTFAITLEPYQIKIWEALPDKGKKGKMSEEPSVYVCEFLRQNDLKNQIIFIRKNIT